MFIKLFKIILKMFALKLALTCATSINNYRMITTKNLNKVHSSNPKSFLTKFPLSRRTTEKEKKTLLVLPRKKNSSSVERSPKHCVCVGDNFLVFCSIFFFEKNHEVKFPKKFAEKSSLHAKKNHRKMLNGSTAMCNMCYQSTNQVRSPMEASIWRKTIVQC